MDFDNQKNTVRGLAGGSTRALRSLESVVGGLDPNQPRAADENPAGNPAALAPRVESLERRINDLNTETARGFEHISDRLRRLESALGL